MRGLGGMRASRAGRRRLTLSVAGILAAAGLLAGGADSGSLREATAAFSSDDSPQLVVDHSAGGGRARTLIEVALANVAPGRNGAARVEIDAPPGYTAVLGTAPGTKVGSAFGVITEAQSEPGGDAPASSAVVAEDPAAYASDPVAQACAPGTYAAVWAVTLSVLGQNLKLPVFVDANADGSARLRFCPVWRLTPEGRPLTVALAAFLLQDAFTGTSAPGIDTWRAFVTPIAADESPGPDASVFELRALLPHPQSLTLNARYEPKSHTAVVNGKFTRVGQPVAGVAVSLSAADPEGGEFGSLGSVKTNASGSFSFRRHVTKTTRFGAAIEEQPHACSGVSAAPAGCVTETITAPSSASATASIPRPTDAKQAIRAADQGLARRVNLAAGDFPPDWESAPADEELVDCPGFRPDESQLTVTGEAGSPYFVGEAAAAASYVRVLATEKQARTAFAKEAQRGLVRCLAEDVADTGEDQVIVEHAGTLRFPTRGDRSRAFRIVIAIPSENARFYLDLVFVQRKRVLAVVAFYGGGEPFPLEPDLVAKMASRA